MEGSSWNIFLVWELFLRPTGETFWKRAGGQADNVHI